MSQKSTASYWRRVMEAESLPVELPMHKICSRLILAERSNAGKHSLRGHDSVSQWESDIIESQPRLFFPLGWGGPAVTQAIFLGNSREVLSTVTQVKNAERRGASHCWQGPSFTPANSAGHTRGQSTEAPTGNGQHQGGRHPTVAGRERVGASGRGTFWGNARVTRVNGSN